MLSYEIHLSEQLGVDGISTKDADYYVRAQGIDEKTKGPLQHFVIIASYIISFSFSLSFRSNSVFGGNAIDTNCEVRIYTIASSAYIIHTSCQDGDMIALPESLRLK